MTRSPRAKIPRSWTEGLLALAHGRRDDALRHLRHGVALAERYTVDTSPQLLLELVRVCLTSGERDEAEAARRSLGAAWSPLGRACAEAAAGLLAADDAIAIEHLREAAAGFERIDEGRSRAVPAGPRSCRAPGRAGRPPHLRAGAGTAGRLRRPVLPPGSGRRARGVVMTAPLRLTRAQIVAFRRRVNALDERLPRGRRSLRVAAWAGLQDSMPRAAVLSITRARRGDDARYVGGPVARAAVGPSVQRVRRRRTRPGAVLARDAPDRREGPPACRRTSPPGSRPCSAIATARG